MYRSLREKTQQFFTTPLLIWYEQHGRKALPWQHPYDPYKVWLSEIMLQQTQVKTVIPYFVRFITHFPDVYRLSSATEDQVLALWSGLGYYSRARHLHQTAQIIHQHYNGQFPEDTHKLMALPGIGSSTAAAISALAFKKPCAILDGNVKRVLSRYFVVQGAINHTKTKKQLLALAESCLSQESPREYTQAIMDLGATCCTPKNPSCHICPVSETCQAYSTEQVDIFPNKQARRQLPLKTEQFLLLYTDNEIYLEKRPNKGIWGGLWCLPLSEKLTQLVANDFLEFKHTFTHFQLHLKIQRHAISPKSREALELSGCWFNQDTVQLLGLPKPMKLVLDAHWIQADATKVIA